MRRTDRENSTEEFYDLVFTQAEEIFIAMNDGVYPYGVILNFVRKDKIIYLHAAKMGKKLDCLRKNGHVAFCVATDIRIDQEKSSTYFKSVYGKGLASIVEDKAEKRHALELLATRYKAKCPVPATDAMADRVAIVKIAIGELSGKACLPTGKGAPDAVTSQSFLA